MVKEIIEKFLLSYRSTASPETINGLSPEKKHVWVDNLDCVTKSDIKIKRNENKKSAVH